MLPSTSREMHNSNHFSPYYLQSCDRGSTTSSSKTECIAVAAKTVKSWKFSIIVAQRSSHSKPLPIASLTCENGLWNTEIPRELAYLHRACGCSQRGTVSLIWVFQRIYIEAQKYFLQRAILTLDENHALGAGLLLPQLETL